MDDVGNYSCGGSRNTRHTVAQEARWSGRHALSTVNDCDSRPRRWTISFGGRIARRFRGKHAATEHRQFHQRPGARRHVQHLRLSQTFKSRDDARNASLHSATGWASTETRNSRQDIFPGWPWRPVVVVKRRMLIDGCRIRPQSRATRPIVPRVVEMPRLSLVDDAV